jgi:hypothetical protein
MSVIAEPKAVSFIAERGGRLYVYTVGDGLKQVRTEPPGDPSIRFDQIEAEGFVMYVEDALGRPETWNVNFHRWPYPHVDVLWDGHQPGATHRGLLDELRY